VIDDWGINTSLEKLPSITADYVFAIYGGSIDNAEDFAKSSAASIEIEKMQVYHAAERLVTRTRSHEKSHIMRLFFVFMGTSDEGGQALTSAATTIFEKTGADRRGNGSLFH